MQRFQRVLESRYLFEVALSARFPFGSPMSTQRWYVKEQEGEIGPLSVTQLRALVASGRVTGLSQVRHDQLNRWVAASRVQGLIPVVPLPGLPELETLPPPPPPPPPAAPPPAPTAFDPAAAPGEPVREFPSPEEPPAEPSLAPTDAGSPAQAGADALTARRTGSAALAREAATHKPAGRPPEATDRRGRRR